MLKRSRESASFDGLDVPAKRRDTGRSGCFEQPQGLVPLLPSASIHIPDIVITQALEEKRNLQTALRAVGSDVVWRGGRPEAGRPVVLASFACTDKTVRRLQLAMQKMAAEAVPQLVGLTPEWSGNTLGVPLALDRTGELAKALKLEDPLGGGVYPLNAVVFFNAEGNEVARICIDYDGHHRDLEVVVAEVAKYIGAMDT